MKKVLTVTMAICILLMSACSVSGNRWKQTTASEDVKPYAEQAIKIVEQYLNFDIDAKAADEKISTLQQRVDRLGIDAEESRYNKADKAIARVIYLLGLVSIKYKSDIALKQDIDILSVQIGKKPSDTIYEPKDFTYSEYDERIAAIFDVQKSSAVNYSISEHDEILSITIYYDAMYGTDAKEITSSTEEIVHTLKETKTTMVYVSVYYTYYNQDIFSIMLTYHNEYGLNGRIFKDDYDDILEEIESEEQLDSALKKAVSFANFK